MTFELGVDCGQITGNLEVQTEGDIPGAIPYVLFPRP